jgi:hypothetical protein
MRLNPGTDAIIKHVPSSLSTIIMVVAMLCLVFVACDNKVPDSGNRGESGGLTDVERMEALRQSQSSQDQQEGMRTALRERQQGVQTSAVNQGSSTPSASPDSRGFWSNTQTTGTMSSLNFDPALIALAGILLTVVATGVTLFKHN